MKNENEIWILKLKNFKMSFENAKIYKLICLTTGKIYIGSTTQSFRRRLNQHKTTAKTKTQTCSSKQIIANNNYVILLVKAIKNCDTKIQMLCWERYYIEKYVCINERIPTRTDAEYRQDNRDKINEKNAIIYQNNKDKIRAKMAIYRQNNKDKIKEKITCECGSVINRLSLPVHRKTLKHTRMLAELLG